jgi:Putative transposase
VFQLRNSRLIAADHNSVTFKYKDYRADGSARYKVMTLAAEEFNRRFLIHVLPAACYPIRSSEFE